MLVPARIKAKYMGIPESLETAKNTRKHTAHGLDRILNGQRDAFNVLLLDI